MREARHDPLSLVGKQILKRYLVTERVAIGGMSVVYKGTDERLKRTVCLKVFYGIDPSQSQFQTSFEHFVQEAFALSQLRHPNTLTIYDFGYLPTESRSPFYVSEFMDCGTLHTLVRREGPLDVESALGILEPIVEALTEAHELGLVHRDIKPSNILFGAVGQRSIVKLADFGIAKAQADDASSIPNRAQETQATYGEKISLYSPGWAAPEQMRGKAVGPTADVFGLGLVLAFMLSGRKVFSDDNVLETYAKRMEGDAFIEKAVSELALPANLSAVVLRACRNEPTERYSSADEFIEGLREAVEREAAARASEQSVASVQQTEPPVPPPLPTASPGLVPAAAESSETGTQGSGPHLLVIDRIGDAEVVAAGRRVRLIPNESPAALRGIGDGGDEQTAGKIRLTFLPDKSGALRVHIKGLNCFVAKQGGRPSSGIDLSSDATVEMHVPGEDRTDTVKLQFGSGRGDINLYSVANVTLAVPVEQAARSVLLDFGPGREMALVYSNGR